MDNQLVFRDCQALLGMNDKDFESITLTAGQLRFKTLTEALACPAAQEGKTFRIGVLPGIYREKVTISRPGIELLGPTLNSKGEPRATLVWNDCAGTLGPDGKSLGTFKSQSLAILAPDFRASNLHFANDWDFPSNEALPSGDPRKLSGSQAVAVKLDEGADRSVFNRCLFTGFQDTLYANAGRHLFQNCTLEGHVDFLFGAGQVLFKSCELRCLGRPGIAESNEIHGYVCAPSTKPDKSTGFIFLNCSVIKGNPAPPRASFALGRPWHPSHSPDTSNCALFYDCWMDDHIRPEAWTSMNSRPGGVLCTYYPEDANLMEFGSRGPGSASQTSPGRRFLEKSLSPDVLYYMVFKDWNAPRFSEG